MERAKSNHILDRLRRGAGRRLVRVGGLATAALVIAAATLTACGTGSVGAGQQNGLSVSVIEPAAGATVSVPFTVKVAASVPLGPTDSGQHHVHIWFDNNEAAYLVVESETVQINDLPAGSHTMHVSLRNANHSAAGAETQIMVTVGGGAPGAATSGPPAAGTSEVPDNPYGY